MASPAVDVGTGTTIVFGTSSWTAEITDFAHDEITRASIDTTNLATAVAGAGKIGSRTFIPADLSDPAGLTINGHFNPDTKPPIEGVAETITITFPDHGGATEATWVFSGFMTGFSYGVPLEDKMTFSAKIKASGNITITSAT